MEARECFVKCCEGRAATLGRDHEDSLSINEAFAGFLKEQQEHDAARSLLLDCLQRKDPVAALRGREFTVKRSSGAWQLVFGAQVEQDKDGGDVVLCYQASTRTHRDFSVRSLQKYNAALFQEPKSGASAVDSAAAIPPLYRAELLYMLACQKPDAERKGDADADFTEVCARTAHAELCRLRGDNHADTLSCLATLAVLLGKQE